MVEAAAEAHGSIVTSNGGPGVTIQGETVPLAELPTEALPQERFLSRKMKFRYSSSKDWTECWKRDRAVCICSCVRRSRFSLEENKED